MRWPWRACFHCITQSTSILTPSGRIQYSRKEMLVCWNRHFSTFTKQLVFHQPSEYLTNLYMNMNMNIYECHLYKPPCYLPSMYQEGWIQIEGQCCNPKADEGDTWLWSCWRPPGDPDIQVTRCEGTLHRGAPEPVNRPQCDCTCMLVHVRVVQTQPRHHLNKRKFRNRENKKWMPLFVPPGGMQKKIRREVLYRPNCYLASIHCGPWREVSGVACQVVWRGLLWWSSWLCWNLWEH